ncbi:uncharacterized protein LOC143917414 [Arctopsyche grandis]|uniref:uncharacterized protein LOC143917414 n=1 Tax=Arctopsyche grandis TaxID=121162 RepID=UPI00406D9577
MNVDVYACFIDYEKAFDNVRHNKLIEILSQIGLDKRDIRLIGELYWNQAAVVRIEPLEDIDSGITINGTVINNIRYADDTVLLTTNFNDLQAELDAVRVACGGGVRNITNHVLITKGGASARRSDLYQYLDKAVRPFGFNNCTMELSRSWQT